MYRFNLPNKEHPPLGFSLTFHPVIHEHFVVDSIHLLSDGTLKWFHHIDDKKLRYFPSLEEGMNYVNKHNNALLENTAILNLNNTDEASLKFKISKAIKCRTRLTKEEALMLRIAKKIKKSHPIPSKNELKIEHESLREPLFKILSSTPYVRVAAIPRYGSFLKKVNDNEWVNVGRTTKKNLALFHRARICEGFDLDPNEHWGKNKALIRKMLLPRANQLLQLLSVKKLLADAIAKGQKVLVWGNHVFWYEESTLQWEVKMVNDRYDNPSSKNTLWVEGPIISRNHARLIVLPYIKSDGTKVSGHTKNAPNDTKAINRDPSEYVELPFNCIDGDLMYGLLGDLHYE